MLLNFRLVIMLLPRASRAHTIAQTNHDDPSQLYTDTNTRTEARVCGATHTSAHIRMRMDMQLAPLLHTLCSLLAHTRSFSSADDAMTRCGALGLRGEMAAPNRVSVWYSLPVVLNAVPIHSQCSDHGRPLPSAFSIVRRFKIGTISRNLVLYRYQ
jgi:hypothetical protein